MEWFIFSLNVSCVLCAQSLQLCLTLCDPKDCGPSNSSIHGVFQATILVGLPLATPSEFVLLAVFSVSFDGNSILSVGSDHKLWESTLNSLFPLPFSPSLLLPSFPLVLSSFFPLSLFFLLSLSSFLSLIHPMCQDILWPLPLLPNSGLAAHCLIASSRETRGKKGNFILEVGNWRRRWTCVCEPTPDCCSRSRSFYGGSRLYAWREGAG